MPSGNLARCVVACEAHDGDPSQSHVAVRAIEKLRLHLITRLGTGGYRALLARALALAKTHEFWLESIHVNEDAALTGFDEAVQVQGSDDARNGEMALLAQLLGLLLNFIGETLTLNVVQDIWPGVILDDSRFDPKETTR